MGNWKGLFLEGLSVAPVMIRQERGDAVGLVDSVVPGMIRWGDIKAVAWLNVSRDGKVTRVSVLWRALCHPRDYPILV